MSNILELRKLSLSFRRVSSNFLNSDRENVDVNLIRLMKFVEETPFIHDALHETIDGVEFDYEKCFISDDYGRREIITPVDERDHLRAQYDYANFLITDEKASVANAAFQYYCSLSGDKVRDFVANAFKPMIDYINDSISTAMMIEEEATPSMPTTVNQIIEHNYGTANAQGTGTITSTNVTHSSAKEIGILLDKIIPSLSQLVDIPAEQIEDVKDDLEYIQEQLTSSTPKKNRLQKAIGGIKKFVSDFGMKLAVSCATGVVKDIDWKELIEQLETFVSTI